MSLYPAEISKTAYGHSLVASEDLTEGSVIGRFNGHLSSYPDIPNEEIRYAILIGQGVWMIPTTDMRFLNHSCQPSCQLLSSSLEVVTIRDVQAKEELTISYNSITLEQFLQMPDDYFWDDRRTFNCQCGAINCLGLINRYSIKSYEKKAVRPSTKLALFPIAGKGRGVIAAERIEKGELFERAPIILSSPEEWPHLGKTALAHYVFGWGKNSEQIATVLGYGSLYNHSYAPNAAAIGSFEDLLVDFFALKTIEEGEEITFNYTGDLSRIWFKVV